MSIDRSWGDLSDMSTKKAELFDKSKFTGVELDGKSLALLISFDSLDSECTDTFLPGVCCNPGVSLLFLGIIIGIVQCSLIVTLCDELVDSSSCDPDTTVPNEDLPI